MDIKNEIEKNNGKIKIDQHNYKSVGDWLDHHRQLNMITCAETCFCWNVDISLMKYEEPSFEWRWHCVKCDFYVTPTLDNVRIESCDICGADMEKIKKKEK